MDCQTEQLPTAANFENRIFGKITSAPNDPQNNIECYKAKGTSYMLNVRQSQISLRFVLRSHVFQIKLRFLVSSQGSLVNFKFSNKKC